MNNEILGNILREKGIYKDLSPGGRNFRCKCPICGDHPDEKKQKHLYIATDKNVYHCFYCHCSGRTSNLIKKITGDNKIISTIFTIDDFKKIPSPIAGIVRKKSLVRNLIKFKFPEIEAETFINKRKYIKERLNYIEEPENIKGLVFDIHNFLRINNIKPNTEDNPDLFDIDFLHSNFVGIVLEHQSVMMCRCVVDNSVMKFVRLPLQEDVLELQDYYSLRGNGNDESKLIVMCEGNFDIFGEYFYDNLNLKHKVFLYVACQGFGNIPNTLKSIIFDHQLFEVDIVILSDTDKEIKQYVKFVEQTEHVVKSLQIYYNKGKEDFGKYPVEPIKGGDLKSVQKYRKNKKVIQRNSPRRNFPGGRTSSSRRNRLL